MILYGVQDPTGTAACGAHVTLSRRWQLVAEFHISAELNSSGQRFSAWTRLL